MGTGAPMMAALDGDGDTLPVHRRYLSRQEPGDRLWMLALGGSVVERRSTVGDRMALPARCHPGRLRATTVQWWCRRPTGGDRIPSAYAYKGTLAMFERAGFRVVARRQSNPTTPVRPIVRLELRASSSRAN